MKTRVERIRHIFLLLVVAFLAMAQGALEEICQFPVIILSADTFTVVPGDSFSLLVHAEKVNPGFSPTYVIDPLPGMSHNFDYGVRGPGTETHAVLNVAVGPDAEPGRYFRRVFIRGSGRANVDDNDPFRVLEINVLPPGGATPTVGAVGIAAGDFHSLAVLSDGTVWAWGDNFIESIEAGGSDLRAGERPFIVFRGTLGIGEEISSSPVPVHVDRLAEIEAISSGNQSSLALDANGAVWTWGGNNLGQLGTGFTGHRAFPGRLSSLSNVVAASSSGLHALAMLSDGTVWAWGRNTSRELGDGSNARTRTAPVRVQGLTDVSSVHAVDGFVSMAILSDGTVWAWGSNIDGTLFGGSERVIPTPRQVPGLTDIVVVSSGFSHLLALDSDGTVWAWGGNDKGQLGRGTLGGFDESFSPAPVQGLSDVIAISAYGDKSLALRSDGTVWAWGNDRPAPAKVQGLTDVVAIAAGGNHSLAIVENCGTVWAWGDNSFGQLGNGSRNNSSVPVPVAGIGALEECDEAILRVTRVGGFGNSVTVDGQDCTPTCVKRYDLTQDPVTAILTATPASGFQFTGWSGDCNESSLPETSPQITVNIGASVLCTASFQDTTTWNRLTVNVNGPGQVFSEMLPGETFRRINCGVDCGEIFERSETVTLQASPPQFTNFLGWGDDCALGGTQTTVTITVDSHKDCSASFSYVTKTLTINRIGNGTVTSSPPGIDCGSNQGCVQAFNGGSTVRLIATPEPGWSLTIWSGHNDCADGQVTMNDDITCNATFQKTAHLVTIVNSSRGRITGDGINCGAGASDCEEAYTFDSTGSAGTKTFTAQAESGYEIQFWLNDCFGGNVNTAQDNLSSTVSLLIDSDKNCGVLYDTDYETFADYTWSPENPVIGERVYFDVTPSGGFYYSGQPRRGSYVWDLANWVYNISDIVLYEWDFDDDGTIDLAGDYDSAGRPYYIFDTPGDYTPRLRVTSSRGRTLQERQDDQTWLVNVGEPSLRIFLGGTGQGGVRDPSLTAPITTGGIQINCFPDCEGEYANNATVHLRALPAPGSNFLGWGGMGQSSECGNWVSVPDPTVPGVSNGFTNVTLNFASGTRKTCTAYFMSTTAPNPGTRVLRLLNDPSNTGSGIIGSRTSGIACQNNVQNCSSFINGSLVILEAMPDRGSIFDGWFDAQAPGGAPCSTTFNIGSNTTCYARFSMPSSARLLTVSVNDNGISNGAVTGMGINCGSDCEEYFIQSARVTLKADDSALNTHFVNWTGNSNCSSTSPIIQVIINPGTNCTANFDDQPPSAPIVTAPAVLDVFMAGVGSGSVDGTGINCPPDCTESFPRVDNAGNLLPPANVTLTATADAGSILGNWLGCEPPQIGNQCNITMQNTGNVTVFFSPAPLAPVGPGVIVTTAELDVTKGGTGDGTVTSSPVGVNCGSDCDEAFNLGDVVTLSVIPDPGTVFSGWRGDSDCTDGVVTMDLDKTCNADFDLLGATLTVAEDGTGSGLVESSPTGIDCGSDCDEFYGTGTVVSLTATPDTGSVFVEWSGIHSDLAITRMEATPSPVVIGGNLTYEIEVTNFGPNDATGVNILTHTTGISSIQPGQATGPAPNATYLSGSAGCSQQRTSDPVECDVGDLVVGDSVTVNITVSPTMATLPASQGSPPMANFASVFTDDALAGNDPDPNSANNTASAETHVLPATGTDLAITRMEATPSPAVVGGNLTYEIEVTNFGPDSVQDVTVITMASSVSPTTGQAVGPAPNATYVSGSTGCSQPQGAGNPVQCSLGNFAAGGTRTVSIVASADAATLPSSLGLPPLTMSAGAFAAGALTGASSDLDPFNNVALVETQVLPLTGADLAITRMKASPNPVMKDSTLTYEIEVTNFGPDAVQNVNLMTLVTGVTAPGQAIGPTPNATYVSGSAGCSQPQGAGNPVECAVGGLAAGDSATFSVVVAPKVATVPTAFGLPPLVNEANVYATASPVGNDPDPDSSNNVASVETTVLPDDCSGTDPVTQVTIDIDRACTATFEEVGFLLQVSKTGRGSGSVTDDQSGIDCGLDCQELYPAGTVVRLEARRDSGSSFNRWDGDCDQVINDDCVTTMDRDKDVEAEFRRRAGGGGGGGGGGSPAPPPPSSFTLTVSIAGTGSGTATTTPAGINCDPTCLAVFSVGQVVDLFALPDANSTFTGWTGDGDCADGQVTMTTNITCAANFAATSFTLTITHAGSGTGVSSSTPVGINCPADCEETYDTGEDVDLEAIPDAGSVFGGWSGDCSGASATITVTMNSDLDCTATFNTAGGGDFTLTVQVLGSGSGRVFNFVPGPDGSHIDCTSAGGDCTHDYSTSTFVELEAQPDFGSEFGGWGGDCDFTFDDPVEACGVTVDIDKTITATFIPGS